MLLPRVVAPLKAHTVKHLGCASFASVVGAVAILGVLFDVRTVSNAVGDYSLGLWRALSPMLLGFDATIRVLCDVRGIVP